MTGLDIDGTRRAVNRTLLALTGAAALCGGVWAGAAALEERGTSVPVPLPDALGASGLHDAVDAGARALDPWRDGTWWAAGAAIAGLAAALCLLLWWLLAQSAPRAPRTLPLPGAGLATRTRALARATAREAEAVPGVTRARVRLARRRRGRVRAWLVVTLSPQAEPDVVLRRLTGGAVPGLRTGSGAAHLDCAIRLRLPSHRQRRARRTRRTR